MEHFSDGEMVPRGWLRMLHLLTKRTSFLKIVSRDPPLEEIVEMKATNVRWFSVALDESTKVSDTRKVPIRRTFQFWGRKSPLML
jgi:hypothetical protein